MARTLFRFFLKKGMNNYHLKRLHIVKEVLRIDFLFKQVKNHILYTYIVNLNPLLIYIPLV